MTELPKNCITDEQIEALKNPEIDEEQNVDGDVCARCHHSVSVRVGSDFGPGDICDSCAHDRLDEEVPGFIARVEYEKARADANHKALKDLLTEARAHLESMTAINQHMGYQFTQPLSRFKAILDSVWV
jgi:hypothetical protein